MTNNHDPLQQLWQQQKVKVPTAGELKAKWGKEKVKHYWYSAMDVFALLLGPVLILLMKDKMHWFETLWLSFVVFVTTIYTGYIVWLRRLAFAKQDASTANYLSLLQNQYRQNVKIAIATKYSTLWLPPLFLVMIAGAYYLEIHEPERLFRKFIFAGGALAISLPPIWIWADRRAKRFQRELALLSQSAPMI